MLGPTGARGAYKAADRTEAADSSGAGVITQVIGHAVAQSEVQAALDNACLYAEGIERRIGKAQPSSPVN
jgi:hypothetical protein